jgi:hypothetical protein
MTDPDPGQRMGGDTHAHRTAHKETREHLWLLHQKLIDMGDLPMWNVYAPPYLDYRDCYVARLCRTRPKFEELPYCFHNEDLDRLRQNMPPTCTIVGRAPNDHPQVIEVWI